MSQRSPLAGIRVTDFSWIGAGSFSTKMLADAGADVIKIESSLRLDSLRVAPPFKDRIKGVNRSGYFSDRNTSKRSLTLNLKEPKALEIAKELIANSDVVANNFTPGVMERLGLGYNVVKAIKPDIIYVSMSMQGQTGPHSGDLGYGLTIGALSGLHHLSGLPDRLPAGTGTNYPDHMPNPCHSVFAILAALRHRRRTGEGQMIDIAQTEPMIALLATAVLDNTVNGRNPIRKGNYHDRFAPQGVYPVVGKDRWIAIAVTDDAEWHGLVSVLGPQGPLSRADWATNEARMAQREAIDTAISVETAGKDGTELMTALQAAGVPAGLVNDASDLITRDAQMAHRGHWVRLDHPEMGESIYNAPPYRFANAEVNLRRPAPLLGEHTKEILTDVLGYSAEETQQMIETGVLI